MSTLPTRLYASVTVPNTPLITSALAFSKTHSTPTLHNHMIRSWLFDTIIADKFPTLHSRDREAHSLAAILHDVGFDPTGALISNDKYFEKQRKPTIYIAVNSSGMPALYTAIPIAMYEGPEVVATAMGIAGPRGADDDGLVDADGI
ncbi:MAG: hypothetical protein Q9199_007005 [Rusavskia elegans]